jgi:hypothetical protein
MDSRKGVVMGHSLSCSMASRDKEGVCVFAMMAFCWRMGRATLVRCEVMSKG